MSVPVRCYTCGKITGNKWEKYLELLNEGYTEHESLDKLGLKRYCCRRMILGNIDVEEILLKHKQQYENKKANK